MRKRFILYTLSIFAISHLAPKHAHAQAYGSQPTAQLAMAAKPVAHSGEHKSGAAMVTEIGASDDKKYQPAVFSPSATMIIESQSTNTEESASISRSAALFNKVGGVAYTEEDMSFRKYWGNLRNAPVIPDGKLSDLTSSRVTVGDGLVVDFVVDEVSSSKNMKIFCSNVSEEKTTLLVKDSGGNVLYQKDVLMNGKFMQRFDLTGLEAGVYYFEVGSGDSRAYNSVLVQ